MVPTIPNVGIFPKHICLVGWIGMWLSRLSLQYTNNALSIHHLAARTGILLLEANGRSEFGHNIVCMKPPKNDWLIRWNYRNLMAPDSFKNLGFGDNADKPAALKSTAVLPSQGKGEEKSPKT